MKSDLDKTISDFNAEVEEEAQRLIETGASDPAHATRVANDNVRRRRQRQPINKEAPDKDMRKI